MTGRIRRLLEALLFCAVLIVLWEGGVRLFAVKPYLLRSLSSIAAEMWRAKAQLWHHSLVTLGEVALGFAFATVLGVALAALGFPIEAIRAVQAQTPGSFLVEVQDTGHSVFYERPVEFNDSLLSLLQMAGFKGRRKSVHSNSAGYKPVVA